MTKEYEYIYIDPNNPPQLPCEKVYHCDGEDQPTDDLFTETLIAIVEYKGVFRFIDSNFGTWNLCKLRVEKKREPDDVVKRLWWYEGKNYVKRLTQWAQTEMEFLEHNKSNDDFAISYAPGPIVPPPEEWRSV